MSTTSSDVTGAAPEPPRPAIARIGADWAAVIVAGVIVVLALAGLLPAIPFLVK